ncbi:hypothetical protein [Pseudoruegeria sp. SK021]|uniref:hypothetical protein n=1 Tax=Pseudoruegeria sp. SK021 TaxID=1933035 RepID=UPI000A22407C|nr:hypothetical protein [Pseudoruegeria sp. SK021]OSP54466.1 hypothetical protein BV911_12780 [Pseudoruegeria sp. SK021]
MTKQGDHRSFRLQLEREWIEICGKSKQVEHAFCAIGLVFISSLVILAFHPPAVLVNPLVTVWFVSLACLICMLPVLLWRSWLEWQHFKKMDELLYLVAPPARIGLRQRRWNLFSDFRNTPRE